MIPCALPTFESKRVVADVPHTTDLPLRRGRFVLTGGVEPGHDMLSF
jgi:hypothetical protein